jgi:hypothetical protein
LIHCLRLICGSPCSSAPEIRGNYRDLHSLPLPLRWDPVTCRPPPLTGRGSGGVWAAFGQKLHNLAIVSGQRLAGAMAPGLMLEFGEGNNRSAQTKLVVCCPSTWKEGNDACIHLHCPIEITLPHPRRVRLVPPRWCQDTTAIGRGWAGTTTGATTSDFLEVLLQWFLCREQWVARSPRIASIVSGFQVPQFILWLWSRTFETWFPGSATRRFPCSSSGMNVSTRETMRCTEWIKSPDRFQDNARLPGSFTATAPGH